MLSWIGLHSGTTMPQWCIIILSVEDEWLFWYPIIYAIYLLFFIIKLTATMNPAGQECRRISTLFWGRSSTLSIWARWNLHDVSVSLSCSGNWFIFLRLWKKVPRCYLLFISPYINSRVFLQWWQRSKTLWDCSHAPMKRIASSWILKRRKLRRKQKRRKLMRNQSSVIQSKS